MKTKSKTSILLLITAVLGLVFAAPVAALASAPSKPSATATFATGALPSPLLIAQADAPAGTDSPWYLRGELWLALISAALATTAIWQNKEKRTQQKISETLVVAIEAASKIPEIQAAEKKLKAKIQEKATAAGVEPALHKLVEILTP